MRAETRDPTQFPSNTPHAAEVRDAQATADELGKSCDAASAPGDDVAADLNLLRGLVAAYGADTLHRMIDSLK